jgi:CCR4-NOT transcription complex subunit 4
MAPVLVDRKHLHNYRVVQRNLVYVIGVPSNFANEEQLRRPEYFGQYGKIGKVVIHRTHANAHTTVSVYVTFVHREDAKAAIQVLDNHWLDQQHLLRASFGTTKYCNNFIRGVPCNNPECVYLHELGEDDDRFTKEEIQVWTFLCDRLGGWWFANRIHFLSFTFTYLYVGRT